MTQYIYNAVQFFVSGRRKLANSNKSFLTEGLAKEWLKSLPYPPKSLNYMVADKIQRIPLPDNYTLVRSDNG